MKYQNTIDTYPAFTIVEPVLFHHGAVTVRAGDQLAVYSDHQGYNGRHILVTAGSVVGSALKDNRDPIAAYERAVENGHETHWLNPQAVTLTSHEREHKVYTGAHLGQWIYFEGRYFVIEPAANDNFRLTHIDK